MSSSNYSVQSVHKRLVDTFHQYLSAQYHIWDEWLISERDRILGTTGNTFQEPRLEATPQYSEGRPYAELSIPNEATSVLEVAANQSSSGIPKTAYSHQGNAIESFYSRRDLIVATGTGSGKTESFLMPILCQLTTESAKRPQSWGKRGVRAILLYPMNALVNDQLGRLRRLLGNQEIAKDFRGRNGRSPTFGMYTGRTPYAGQQTKAKDKSRVVEEVERLYFKDMTTEYRERLIAEGKWPAKDLKAFLASNLRTSETDAELFTRHEMQITAPDILVTNYSMLEYMMLRPLEAPLFQQTAEWLASNSENRLTIVLDEAHMYRGSGGAEVAYLLRRLQARLEVPRDRITFILTSASLGSSEAAKADIKDFAGKLTGGTAAHFDLITGNVEKRTGGHAADKGTQRILARFNVSPILEASASFEQADRSLVDLAKELGIQIRRTRDTVGDLQAAAYDILEQLPVASLASESLTTSPMTVSDCAARWFPEPNGQLEATEVLLALMAFAKDPIRQRPYCPIRSHQFFRGLAGLFACTNTMCALSIGDDPHLLGRLHASETLRCNCGSRVYELLTHRSCGASYLRAFMQGADGDFLWHQPSNGTWTDTTLTECQFYVVPRSELDTIEGTMTWLHTPTGRLFPSKPDDASDGDYLALLRPDSVTKERGRTILSFGGGCPACGKRTRPKSPVAMDLVTKGEAPFAHIVRAQVSAQPASKKITPNSPNGGRKTIIFSDGRQKAARLAREIPREIELDVFRQTMFMAAGLLSEVNEEARLNETLYIALLKCLLEHNLRFFDGEDRIRVEEHIRSFQTFYDGNLEEQLEDGGLTPPPSYWSILLKQLGTPFYSVSALTLGYATPTKRISKRLRAELSSLPNSEVDAIANIWIQQMLSRFAFGKELADGVRNQASRYPLKLSTADDGLSSSLRELLVSKGLDVKAINSTLAANLCEAKPDGSIYLKPSHLVLRAALDEEWAQCPKCRSVSPCLVLGHCPNCASPHATLVDPNETSYLRARKGFWRDPVAEALAGTLSPMNIDVQEHSAQLSYKDADNPAPTSEIFERQFRDILRPNERSIDVLSCTTTMEVGIDIGSLIAVSMRNVPPMRQNYQQRAGRAGRRGSAVSTVVTYAQPSAHDSYYFKHPDRILTGDPPRPVLDTTNSRITDRHVLAQLLQDFFRPLATSSSKNDIFTVLGDTWSFYHSNAVTSIDAFKEWVATSAEGNASLSRAQLWLPVDKDATVVADHMIAELDRCRPTSEDGLESSLIEFLFARGLLPSYAFPTDLCALQIQERVAGGGFHVVEQAQQGLSIALSEYAPGRLVVVNKKTYRIGTVATSGPDTDVNRAEALFDRSKVYRHCTQCSFSAGFIQTDDRETLCPQCGENALRTMTVIRPEMVFPCGREELDEFDDQVFSRVTKAQLPLPEEDRRIQTRSFGKRGGLVARRRQRLIVVNEGDPDSQEAGFRVCNKCGKVLLEGDAEAPHLRDYFIRSPGRQPPPKCNGEFKTVFLGYGFTSDVLLLRIALADPLRFGVLSRRDRRPLEDALQTLCEALTHSIGRVLDVDVREVSAGFRFGNDGTSEFADIFIYDTLSGGAGYAFQTGEIFSQIFNAAKDLLRGCSCTTSCENCLRHYSNRFSHADLDRNLGLALAEYVESGQVDPIYSAKEQSAHLASLIQLMELAGWTSTPNDKGVLATKGSRSVLVSACPSLRACKPKIVNNGQTILTFTPYELERDLPSSFAEIA